MPAWAAQQQGRSVDEQRRWQLTALARGDARAADLFDVPPVGDDAAHYMRAMCATAAAGGHLAVLQWLHARGCDGDADTCSEAARRGDLVMLQWARANGCDWGAQTYWSAQRAADSADVLQWLDEQGCPH